MRRRISCATILAAALSVAALCGGSTANAEAPARSDIVINGAGATFPYPLYSSWAYDYEKLTGVKVNYQSIGSGGGIAQIKANTVDFGASDAPLEVKELDESGLVQFPMVIGGVVPVVNVKGVRGGEMRLTSKLLADVFLGKVKSWDDPAIKEVNPGLKLPGTAITVVHRSDGSGTTWIFTDYLSKVSDEWKAKVGTGKAVAWPTGVGGKGNEGVAAYVQRVDGAIGYVEYAYAVQNNLSYAVLKNRNDKFATPTIKSFQAAAANADWKGARGYYVVLTDQPGDDSWPITGASFIIIHKLQPDAEKAKAMFRFFDWCYRHGGTKAEELKYVPIPGNVVDLVEATWKGETSSQGQPVWE